jgi:AcrR family transcriptional regulator
MRERNERSLFFRHLDLSAGARSAAGASQRARMQDGIMRAVAHKGYGNVSVGDVVAAAGVSKRTFYEHFADKEECFLEAYRTGSQAVVEDIAAAVRASGETDWEERMRVGLDAYTRTLASEPDLAQTLLVDVLGAGPRAIALRRQVLGAFAELFRPGPDGSDVLAAVPDTFRRALVGAVGELVQEHIYEHGAESLPELAPTLAEVARAVISAGSLAQPASG